MFIQETGNQNLSQDDSGENRKEQRDSSEEESGKEFEKTVVMQSQTSNYGFNIIVKTGQ